MAIFKEFPIVGKVMLRATKMGGTYEHDMQTNL